MYGINNQMRNAGAILSDLQEAIQQFDESAEIYLGQTGNNEVLNPVQNRIQIDSMGINESIPLDFFARFGIRSLILNAFHGRLSLSDLCPMIAARKNAAQCKWQGFKNELIVEDLKMLFRNCQIVTFANWANGYDVADLWDSLRRDVIKQINKRDADFIFYLGDGARKFAFDLDNTLDIISDFSLHGRVTLVLEEKEAVGLCNELNGRDTGFNHSGNYLPNAREEFFSLFNTMRIDYLLIYSVDNTLLFSKQHQFELPGRASCNVKALKEVRDDFNAGCSLGLLLRLEIQLCIALGLAVAGAHNERGARPDRKALALYVKEWMTEIGSAAWAPVQ